MNAKEAKAAATLNKKHKEETQKAKINDVIGKDIAILYKHFSDKIDTAVNSGHISTSSAGQALEFAGDRFDNKVITTVVDKLREEGYNVTMNKHHAYNKLIFEVSWN